MNKSVIDEAELLARFRNPPSGYRGLLFWAWNGALEEKELKRQILEMRDAGVGGFFIHSRDGLETTYMGDEWKRLTRVSVLYAGELGLEAWLYDEDRWPSGTAGGTVPARWGDDARCKGLTLEVRARDAGFPRDETLALYAAEIKGTELLSLRRTRRGEAPENGELLLAARLEVSGKSEWFNDEAPPDNLNPVSVRHFIEATHEAYKAVCGEFFGSVVPGIFTDEPSLNDRHAQFPPDRGWIPWTENFEKYFIKKRGYDPFETLPYLYFNGKKSAKIRHDYWRTITERYAETYSGEISNWCGKNNIAYTGHFLQEDKLGLSARVNGGVMPHYQYQDIPGIDILCERADEYLTVKQCTSVARQYGKPVVLSESYGCTGWDFSFEGQKWVGDWQYVLGVNRLVKHMALYTLKGCGKRDYPPSFNYNNTWWRYAKTMEDYHGRLSSVLAEGVPARDVLVLHPASTAWARLGCDPYGNPRRNMERDVPAINQYGREFNDFLAFLSGIHYDYDLGDELLLERDGAVRDKTLVLARAAYPLVILPPVDTLLGSTVKLLRNFLDAGGNLLAMIPLPFMIEGEQNDEVPALFRHPNAAVADNAARVEQLLEARLERRIGISGPDGGQDTSLLYILKDAGNFFSLFVVNNDRANTHKVKITLPNKTIVSLRKLNLLTGRDHVEKVIDGYIMEEFGPADSALYLFEKAGKELPQSASFAAPVFSQKHAETFYASFPPECAIRRNMPNALTLDTCTWSFTGERESGEMEVWRAQAQIRAALGMMDISYNGLIQRYRWADKPHPADGKEVTLVFRFTANAVLENTELVLEDSKEFRVFLNGAEISNKKNGWFLDRGFDRIPLPPLGPGENKLKLVTSYRNRAQLEDVYLTGAFSVDSRRRLDREEPFTRLGDWTLQGYPHYAGSMIYTWDFYHDYEGDSQVILELEKFSAVTIRLSVNQRVYEIPWKAAARVDITEALIRKRKNIIAVEVAGSPRNLLGPFHIAEKDPKNIGDHSFHPQEPEYVDGYNLHPYGLFVPPRLMLRKSI